jgi:hypothetical protein
MAWSCTAVPLKRYAKGKPLSAVRNGELEEHSKDDPVVYSIKRFAEKRHVPAF